METKFQTSFIPKKPLAPIGGVTPTVGMGTAVKTKHRNSLFFNISVILFLISLLAAGGLFGYEQYAKGRQNYFKQTLDSKVNQFDPAKINELRAANVKIDTAKRLLAKHLALSNLFSVISTFTVQDIRFLNLDVTPPSDTSADMVITMSGQGKNLNAVAFQGDVLSQLKQYGGLDTVIKNPTISNPLLAEDGSVSFGFTASVDPSSFYYLKPEAQNNSKTPVPPTQ